jgi:hypothetical protein
VQETAHDVCAGGRLAVAEELVPVDCRAAARVTRPDGAPFPEDDVGIQRQQRRIVAGAKTTLGCIQKRSRLS